MVRSQITSLTLYQLAIPMRHRVKHVAAERSVADPIVVVVRLADGTVGYGETLARPYVTGETHESVVGVIEHLFLPALVAFRPENFPEALELTDSLPLEDTDGNIATAARAGVELALLDAYSRAFKRPITELVGWLGLPGLGEPGSSGKVRFSGVLAEEHGDAIKKRWRVMRLYGLRDYKLKVGFDSDADRLRLVERLLGKAARSQRGTLRLDANEAWDVSQAREVLAICAELHLPVVCIEQPLPRGCEGELNRLREFTGTAIMLDESLVTRLDAEESIEAGFANWFNLRLAKNGGLMETIRLAALGRKHGIGLVLGCLVGETSILGAAARKFLECVPGVRFAEGNFGTFLLKEDVTAQSVRFSCGGRWKPIQGLGWGVEVLPERLARLSPEKPLNFVL